jgi:hypothetical protein
MEITDRKTGQVWLWAAIINLMVFVLLWIGFLKIPAPATSGHNQIASGNEQGAGNTFGQMTHLVGNESIAGNEPVVQPGTEMPPLSNESQPGQWINEFYLDRGPAISFAPRLNPDGSPRSLPDNQEWVKSPTYENQETTLSAEDLNPAVMNPPFFSKSDLPVEFRNFNYQLTVRVRLDARGRVVGRPNIVRGSSNPVVDQATIDKIMNEVTFTPATRKDTGQPVPSEPEIPVFWN